MSDLRGLYVWFKTRGKGYSAINLYLINNVKDNVKDKVVYLSWNVSNSVNFLHCFFSRNTLVPSVEKQQLSKKNARIACSFMTKHSDEY